MCGIAGIYNFRNQQVNKSELDAMKNHILHRGPDGSGVFLESNVGLVHTRLSIQDLSNAAHQPMVDEVSSCCISYNGEIYNFKELREDLIKEGISFNSTGDTEVLLKACIHYGVVNTLPKLNGMFAFAFWNGNKNELFVARDRMGIKPFYYTVEDGRFRFASEIKALINSKSATPDMSVLYEILSGGTNCEPYTLFSDIHALNPGNYIHIQNDNKIIQKEYFSIFNAVNEDTYHQYNNSSFSEIVNEFGQLLDSSVAIHSISDAPVAAFVSGGIDSSLISTLTKKYCPDISLYHADVIGENSEKIYAEMVAEYLNLNFVTAEITKESYINELVNTTYFHEMPSAYHPNDVPFQLISKRAHQDGIKVVLTGEGADELFIGYGLASKEILRDKISYSINKTPVLKQFGALASKLYPSNSDRTMIESLSSRGFLNEWTERAQDAYHFIRNPVEKQAAIKGAIYQKSHLNSLLQRNDRMGMMHGLESRIPFLENNIVNFAVSLPMKYKHPSSWFSILKGNPLTRNKTVVRQSANNILPDSIIKRKKLGFPITPESYININNDFFKNGFLEESLKITHNEMCRLLSYQSSDSRWNLFSTELFGKLFFQNEQRDKIQSIVTNYIVK